MATETAYTIVTDILEMIDRDEEVDILKKRLQDLYLLGYDRGIKAGREDQCSRDYASRYGHDMGQ